MKVNKEHFPIFAVEEARSMYLQASELCNEGIQKSTEILSDWMEDGYEEEDITRVISHLTFCLDRLEMINNQLNLLNVKFN
jgi:hypothetical protein